MRGADGEPDTETEAADPGSGNDVATSTSERIIEATSRLLETRTLREISVADILNESGYARGTFYLWFDNKFDVAGKAYRQSSLGVESAARGLFTASTADRDERRMRVDRVFDELLVSWRDHGHVLRAVNDTWRTEPTMATYWLPAYEWVLYRLAKLIAAVRGRDSTTEADRVLASALINMNEHTLYQASLNEGFDLEAIRGVLADIWYDRIFVNGL